MPSPVGHVLGGVIVALALAPKHAGREAHQALRVRGSDLRLYSALCIVAACLPDIDFAWGRHSMETHSLTFAVLCGLGVLAWRRSPRLATAFTLAVASHVLLDWLGSDDSPPLGVMALWPFSRDFYFAEAYVFQTISRRYWLPGFVMHNALAVLREIALLLPLAAGVFVLRRRR